MVLPPPGLPGITLPVTVPTIHTESVPTVRGLCLPSWGHGARLSQPGTAREGIVLPAINTSDQSRQDSRCLSRRTVKSNRQ